jgi:hypothetical protein
MTLELKTTPAWYNDRLAKSIGQAQSPSLLAKPIAEFPGSVKWPYCGAKPLGYGWGIEMSRQGISR